MNRDAAARAADVVRHADIGLFHLAFAAITAQLIGNLVDLRQSGCRNRMALGFQPARRIDRHLAIQIDFSRTDQLSPLARRGKAQIFI